MKTLITKSWVAAGLLTAAMAAQGATVYSNTNTDTGYVLNFPNGQEIGDQIVLANSATYPYLTGFSFEYYSPNASFTGTVTADLRFYLNDGPQSSGADTPGTPFYDSGPFDISAPESVYGPNTNSMVRTFSVADLYQKASMNMNPSFQLPSQFTVTLTFEGLSGTDSVGANLFWPATVGSNYGDYWYNNGGNWQLMTKSVPVAFGMYLDASSQAVPEPMPLCLVGVGMALLALTARQRRYSSFP